MTTIREAEEILKKEYHRDNFLYLVKDVLLPGYKNDEHPVIFDSKIFNVITQLGKSDKCDLMIFEVILNEGTQNRRVAITQGMFRVLRAQRINNALVAFSNNDGINYRISLLTSKYEFEGDKIVKVISNPRRYSYSLGYGTKTRTAFKFLIEKGKVDSLDDLINRFSVEVVNKQFYNEIALRFTELVGGEREGKKYKPQLKIHGTTDQNKNAEFAVRLIGRIVFCWFLKEKKSESGISLMPDTIFSPSAIKENQIYYHTVLEPLFFELLNTEQKKRKGKFCKKDIYKQIPYLNGGLFSPHADDHYQYSSATESGAFGIINIPDQWFESFFEVLDQYNFTVDENTTYDVELSIDPEMLGRIFENLLAEINPETGESAKKSTGSFYTPREIVEYMVDSSLYEYLHDKTGIDSETLKAIISYSKNYELSDLPKPEKKKIIDALYTLTVLDPACGSGAFPIGMLQKMVYILQEIDPEANLWFDKATENVSFLLKKEFEKKFNAGSLDYIRKLSVIQNSIFGVDIQPIAVEIARLRCFLSLIIEEKVNDNEENRGINPLPNLEFKFVIANTLIGLEDNPETILFEDKSHIVNLKKVRDEYFNADNEQREELKLEFVKIQKEMTQAMVSHYKQATSSRYKSLLSWEPFKYESIGWFDPEWMFGVNEGFDVVIGNPPYGVSIKDKLQREFLNLSIGKVPDYEIYYYFINKSYILLKKNGICSFIIPNTILFNLYAQNYRISLFDKWLIAEILDCTSFAIFENATVRNIIFRFIKDRNSDTLTYCPTNEIIGFNSFTNKKRATVTKNIAESNIQNWGLLFKLTEEVLNIVSKIKNKGNNLKSIFPETSQGLIAYDKYRGQSEDVIKSRAYHSFQKTKESQKKWLYGEDITRYSVKWNEREYIEYGSNIANPRNPKYFDGKRILIREITNPRIFAAITEDELYNDPSILIIKDNPYGDFSIECLLAILNSKLATYYHFNSSPKATKGAFPKILVNDINSFPIPNIPSKSQQPIINLVEKILSAKKINPAIDTSDLEKEIDVFVYKLYGLTKEEIAIVEGNNE